MKQSSNEAAVRQKMKMTFKHRRQMVLDDKSSDVLTEYPRFKDVKGLVIDLLNYVPNWSLEVWDFVSGFFLQDANFL